MNERLLKKYDVMISYSTKTKAIGDDVREILEEKGYAVWMAPESIPSGECYDNEIYAAIENSSIVLFLLCEPSLKSRWCNYELKYAANINKCVLPVSIETVENPYEKLGNISCVLGKRQIFDMFPEYEKKLTLIADRVDYLLNSEESVRHPYPIVSAEMQDLDSGCIGRSKEVQEINELISAHDTVNVYGFGGMGKTSVIKKFFADNFLSSPYLTIHVAKYTNSIVSTIAHIPFVGFDEDKFLNEFRDDTVTKEEALFAKKVSFLNDLKNTCLLVIDGMDYVDMREVETVARLRCHKIIVSRNRYDGIAAYEIGTMEEDDLLQFFDGVNGAEEEREQLLEIIRRVGKHTLTISLISSYCREFEYTPQEVLEEGVCDDLGKYDSDDKKISDLLDRIPLTEEEIYCLKVLALFPNGISKGKLQKTDREVVRIAQRLVKKSLVVGSSSTFQLHQIVRELVVAKYGMDVVTLKPFLDTFLDVMRKLDIEENELFYVLTNMDQVLQGEGDLLIKAYHYIGTWVCDYAYMSLFHINHELYKNSNVSGQDINNTKQLHFDRFRYAEKMHLKARELASRTDSPFARQRIADITSMLGADNYNMNNFEIAFNWQKEALALAEEHLTEKDRWFHHILSRIGLTALHVNEPDVALTSFNRLLKIGQEDNFQSFAKSSIVYRLGLLYKMKKEYALAKEYFLEALADERNSLLAQSELYLHLAEVALSSGDKDEAKAYYLKGREIRLSLMETEEAAADFVNTHDKIYLE